MRPTAVLIAIVFGSAAAISFGLTTTSVVFVYLRNDYPELARELWPFIKSCLWFLVLSAVSGAALFSTLKGLRWRGYAQIGMVLTLALVGFVYWPTR